MITSRPTVEGFLIFIRNAMGISPTILPDNAWSINFSYLLSVEVVYRAIAKASPVLYTVAVYNLAGSNLLTYAQDLPDAPPVPGTEPPLPFFQAMRKKWNTNGFVSGVIQSASDVTTSESMVVMEAAKDFTLANLQQIKDPWGRAYLAIAQDTGTLWGLS